MIIYHIKGKKEKMKLENKRNYLKEKGITLIALVITIAVLLILAAVSISALFGDSGIIDRAKEAQDETNQATERDKKEIKELSNWLDSKINGNKGENTTGEDGNQSTTPKISTLVGTVVDKNTKAEDAYGNKITIPKGFKILAHSENTTTGDVTYTYSGDNIPAVQDGIVIENGTDGNQFVWVPVGTIKNKDNTKNTITLGRYSDFTAKNGVYTPAQTAENYTQETKITMTANIQKQNYTIAKLGLEDEKEITIKINKAIQLEGIFDDVKVIKTSPDVSEGMEINYKELTEFRSGNTTTDSTAENATARDLKTFVESTLANGGYYIARFEASKNTTTNKIESQYNKMVLTSITQPNAATLAREMYGEIKENNELIYASDLVNSYAWDTAIIFIQTYSTGEDASSYASQNKSTSFANTGKNNDKYCNIWDMSGNACEWTTEYSTYASVSSVNPCVFRGGHCSTVNGEAYHYASNREYHRTTASSSDFSLRSLLYVK